VCAVGPIPLGKVAGAWSWVLLCPFSFNDAAKCNYVLTLSYVLLATCL